MWIMRKEPPIWLIIKSPAHLRPAKRPPLLAVAVPAFGMYGEGNNRKL